MTLKLNELRIGNWLQFMDEPPQQLTAYTMASLCQNRKALEFYKPIAISEMWLTSFRFTYVDNEWTTLRCLEFGLVINEQRILHVWDGSFSDAPCDYLHQLQNLYFTLTGTEL